MRSTVVGSYPVELKEASGFKDKLLKSVGAYDPFKESIKHAVFSQLDAGVDIISDGQVRGDMVSSFSKFIPGFKIEDGNTYIVSKIRNPTGEISVSDLLYAKKLIKEYYNGDVPEGKGIKGIITGPSTIIHSSRITSFYKNKDDAIIDLAHSLKKEVDAIEKKVKPVYIQVDEPFLSTGMVNMKVAREAIGILHDGLSIPLAMHVCGTLEGAYKDIANFDVDILDFEFAGNNVNLDLLEKNIKLFEGKKIGFGCIDSSKNEVDSKDKTQELISKGVDIIGKDNILLDPDCGLRRAPMDVAFKKLKLMNDIKDSY
ncbi:MAG: methionine synthase [Methanobrevibacter millerae]|uniref:Methionine synthase n=1 Tax=Methanobrevibacter millerae TaxID=230361 RepID=A0A8T3VLU3_9EURY|nr:methionine synthase [Methanobrevibacter millerae]MBE6505164.1 methionine synthase [Methanobrevibacter millerae]